MHLQTTRLDLDSEESLELLRALDDGAWNLLLDESRKRLIAYFVAIDLAHEAEDLTSRTLVRLIKSGFINYDRDKSSVLTWVVNTGKLIAREHFRDEVRQRKLLLESERLIDRDEWAQEKKSGASRQGKLARRALESLSTNERIILHLRFGEALSFELIAENLEISQVNARVRLTRARKKLCLEFERLQSRESRKRIVRSGPRNTRSPTSPPSGGEIQAPPLC